MTLLMRMHCEFFSLQKWHNATITSIHSCPKKINSFVCGPGMISFLLQLHNDLHGERCLSCSMSDFILCASPSDNKVQMFKLSFAAF